VEGGVLYLGHSYQITAPYSQSVSVQMTEIPYLLRFSPIPFVDFAGGGYLGFPNQGGATDIGLLIGAGVRVPLSPLIKARFLALYEWGFANLGTSARSLNSRNLDLLAGMMIDLW
jgi:hypothetical protein